MAQTWQPIDYVNSRIEIIFKINSGNMTDMLLTTMMAMMVTMMVFMSFRGHKSIVRMHACLP